MILLSCGYDFQFELRDYDRQMVYDGRRNSIISCSLCLQSAKRLVLHLFGDGPLGVPQSTREGRHLASVLSPQKATEDPAQSGGDPKCRSSP